LTSSDSLSEPDIFESKEVGERHDYVEDAIAGAAILSEDAEIHSFTSDIVLHHPASQDGLVPEFWASQDGKTYHADPPPFSLSGKKTRRLPYHAS